MRQRFVVGRERSIARQRRANLDDLWVLEADVVFVQLDVVGNPELRRVPKNLFRAGEIQPIDAALRKGHVAHRDERHANQEAQTLAFRFQHRLNRDVVRDLVGRRRRAGKKRSKRDQRAQPIRAEG